MIYYKNGRCLGTAWEDVYAGTYFPAMSFYKGCTASFNFGPNFKYPPNEDFRPVTD